MTNSERVIYEALIKIIVGKEVRFEMETTGISKGDESKYFHSSPEVSAFYVALKGYEIRDIEGWSRFANGDSTVASPFDKGDVPFVEQAARETRTRYYISSTVDEASSLLVANRRRIDESGLNHAESTESRRTSIQAIEKEERRRAEEALKAGGVVVALADKSLRLNFRHSSPSTPAHTAVIARSSRQYPRSLPRGYCYGCSECGGR